MYFNVRLSREAWGLLGVGGASRSYLSRMPSVLARLGPVEDDRLVEISAPDQLRSEFIGKSGRIPRIAQKHGEPPDMPAAPRALAGPGAAGS